MNLLIIVDGFIVPLGEVALIEFAASSDDGPPDDELDGHRLDLVEDESNGELDQAGVWLPGIGLLNACPESKESHGRVNEDG